MILNHTGIFKNWNKKIYISTKLPSEYDLYGNEINIYDTPFYLGMHNYQPLKERELYAYMSYFGETKHKLIRLLLDIKHEGKIKEFDKVYLYGATPKDEKINGQNANYYVKSIVPQNTKILIIFEEIIKEEN